MANTLSTLVLIKPDKKDKWEYVVSHLKNLGLEIINVKELTFSSQQADLFYREDVEWLRKLGKKIYSSCSQEGIDAFSRFQVSKNDFVALGKIGSAWNKAYLKLGSVIAILIGPNGSRAENFFPEIEEAVDFLRMVLCNDTFKRANEEGRAYHNGIHLARTPEEFNHQVKIIWPEE